MDRGHEMGKSFWRDQADDLHFESPPTDTRIKSGLPQQLLTYSRRYGDGNSADGP
jgi:hypothetical protein